MLWGRREPEDERIFLRSGAERAGEQKDFRCAEAGGSRRAKGFSVL